MAADKFPDLKSRSFAANPHPLYARLRAEAPVCRVRWFLWLRVWLVTRYDDVLGVLTDERFSNRFVSSIPLVPPPIEAVTRNMLATDPPDHTRLRKLVCKAFTPRMVERLGDRIQRVCDELLDAAAANGRVDLVREYASPLPLAVIADLLGIPRQDRRQFGSWSKQFAAGSSGALYPMVSGVWAMWKFRRYFRGLVALRRSAPQDDLVTALIQVEEDGDGLSEDELVAMLAMLLFAGFETTVHLVASGALALIQHPRQRALLQADPALAGSAVEELLRYTSPLQFASPRVAREDVTLAGTCIPRGTLVLAGLGSANRDESHFRDPEILDLTREPNRHLALGTGAHSCLGAPLARLEGQIALTTLFRRFPELRLARAPESLRWHRGLLFRGLEDLPLVW